MDRGAPWRRVALGGPHGAPDREDERREASAAGEGSYQRRRRELRRRLWTRDGGGQDGGRAVAYRVGDPARRELQRKGVRARARAVEKRSHAVLVNVRFPIPGY